MVVWWACVCVLAVLGAPWLLRWLRRLRRYRSLLDQLPGPKPGLILGSAHEYMVPREKMAAVFDRRFKTYGGLIRVWNIVYLDVDVFISKPEYLEVILNSTKHIAKSVTYDRMQSWLGTGLLTSTGSKWQHHRKLITPAFHFKILEEFFEVFVEKSNILVSQMKQLPEDKVVDLMPLIAKCTLDIICETAMGTQLNIQEDQQHEAYVQAVYDLSEIVLYREFRPWIHPDFIFYNTRVGKRYAECLKILHGFTEKVIQERKLQRKDIHNGNEESDSVTGSRRSLALLDLLLETGLSVREVRDEVDTFMFEGHDTTGMALTWTIYLLARHPHIQDAAVEELEQIFRSSGRSPGLQDLADMKLLERIIKEALRLYPSVPFIARHLHEDCHLGDGLTIPAGTNVSLDIYHTHRDPEHFPYPDTFNPDNFLPENTRKRHPFSYIPFSAGPRNCIGQKFAMMEEKAVISSILRNFKIESAGEITDILQELTLRPATGLPVKLTPRTN